MNTLYENPFTFACIILIIAILRLLARYNQLQQALYWLHSRHHEKMRYEAQVIREKTLQDLFTFRRSLELSQVRNQESKKSLKEYDLEAFENIHNYLKELSEYLYPPYVDDKLSLAIAYLLESWKSKIPHLNVKMNILSEEKLKENCEYNRIILMVLEEIFQTILPLTSEELSIFTNLDCQGYQNKLIVQLNSPSIFKLELHSCIQQLDFVKNTFQFLISGKCFYHQAKYNQTWYFYWHN